MLSGISQLTILDPTKLLEEDLDTNFFVNSGMVGEYTLKLSFDKIKELNPRVELIVECEPVESKKLDFFSKFDLIVATEVDYKHIVELNLITRSLNIPFYSAGLHGLYGYIFVDLIQYIATVEQPANSAKLGPVNSVKTIIKVDKKQQNDQLIESCQVQNVYKPFAEIGDSDTVSKLKEFFNTKRKLKKISIILPSVLTLLEHYPLSSKPIDEIDIDFDEFARKLETTVSKLGLNLNIDTNEVQNFITQAFAQFQPTGAIIGGALSQDIIQYLSGKQCFNNFVILDAVESKMPIYTI